MSKVLVRTKKYDEKLVEYLKSLGGKWDPNKKTWTVYANINEIKNKIKELNLEKNVEVFEIKRIKEEQEGNIVMRLSKDNRFALLSINLIAFKEDLIALLKGRRKVVRFRVLPYKKRKKG